MTARERAGVGVGRALHPLSPPPVSCHPALTAATRYSGSEMRCGLHNTLTHFSIVNAAKRETPQRTSSHLQCVISCLPTRAQSGNWCDTHTSVIIHSVTVCYNVMDPTAL